VATYVLIAIVKKEFQLNAWLCTLRQVIFVSVLQQTPLSVALLDVGNTATNTVEFFQPVKSIRVSTGYY
jgi:hypothetical protein